MEDFKLLLHSGLNQTKLSHVIRGPNWIKREQNWCKETALSFFRTAFCSVIWIKISNIFFLDFFKDFKFIRFVKPFLSLILRPNHCTILFKVIFFMKSLKKAFTKWYFICLHESLRLKLLTISSSNSRPIMLFCFSCKFDYLFLQNYTTTPHFPNHSAPQPISSSVLKPQTEKFMIFHFSLPFGSARKNWLLPARWSSCGHHFLYSDPSHHCWTNECQLMCQRAGLTERARFNARARSSA